MTPPQVHADDTIETAVRRLVESELSALPVVDARERFVGVFGEREFMAALFPGYVSQLKGAGFLRHALDIALEKRECRAECVGEHMNREHVEVGPDHSDVQVAEIFLHHRVLIVPVVDDDRHVVELIARREFFRELAQRFLAPS